MNSKPQLPNTNNPRGHPTEIEQAVLEKSQNFVGRQFVFTALSNFLYRHNRGYFTIVGAPGSGKSAILSNYVRENLGIIYYNAQIKGKNRAKEFLPAVCQQIIEMHSQSLPEGLNFASLHQIPNHTTQGSSFLSLLLQKISDRLEPSQRLMIAIDGCDLAKAVAKLSH